MAAAFSITTGTNAIRLDADRKAVAVFTVVNETGRPLRARASVSPFEPTPPGWFSIADEAERLFPLDGAEAFTVKVVVPPDAPPGRQNFRLDVVSIERPDEEWAHGPAVGFEVAPPPVKPVPPPPKGYVETLLGAAAGSLLGALLATIVGVLTFILALGQRADLLGHQYFDDCFAQSAWFFGAVWICNTPGPFGWSTLIAGIVVAAALAGSIGIVVMLLRKSITSPEPWQTALVFGVLFTILATVLGAVWGRIFPPPPNPLFSFVTPPSPVVVIGVLVVMLIAAVVVSALAGRAISRFRVYRSL
jgi:hypothetical protein